MNRLKRVVRASVLLAAIALALPALAGEAEDAEYAAAVEAAMKAPRSADYGRMRTLYAETSHYAKAKAATSSLMGKYIMAGNPAPQALKDEALVVLKTDFALPETHPAVIAIMGYRQGMAQTELHAAAYQGLVQAIIDSGDGETPTTARKVLTNSEDMIVIEQLGLENIDHRKVEEGGKTFSVFKIKGSWWSGDYEAWFDTTAFGAK